MTTRINYHYRDAANWKFHGSVLVSGRAEKADFEQHLFDGEFFVPERVGLRHLLTEPWNSDDHLLHELGDFEITEPDDTNEIVASASELLDRFRTAAESGWFTQSG